MGLYLNPGNEGFKRALRAEIYVDKSGMIEYVNRVLGTDDGFICVSRPRRFGKSMAANMLAAYYDKSCDSQELFRDLEIAKAPSYQEHLNKHDVVMVNVQKFLRESENPESLVSQIENKLLAEFRSVYPQWIDEDENSLPDALEVIFSRQSDENRGFIFIIDEWDCIFREAKENIQAQKEYLDFLRDLFKDRVYVKAAYMTGILPIKKYGTHSALNIFDEFSMTSAGKLAKYAGFTEEEVVNLCHRYGKDFGELQEWYDGYLLGKHLHIYNPKSVVDSMQSDDLKSFWTGTETYEALQIYIDLDMDGIKQDIISMLGGEKYPVDVDSFQNDMTTFRGKDDILSLLVHLGYLAYDEKMKKVFILSEAVRRGLIMILKQKE